MINMHEHFAKRQTYHILIVDDDDVFRSSHRRLLSLFRIAGEGANFIVSDVARGVDAMAVWPRAASIACCWTTSCRTATG